jgi:hypothetical protein
MSQKRDNTGVLFRNSRKKLDPLTGHPLKGEEDKPDLQGEATIDKRDYWLAAWRKESEKQGQPYLSLAFTLKTGKDVGS